MSPNQQSPQQGPLDIGASDSELGSSVTDKPALIDCELADARAGGQRVIAMELFALLCRHLPASRDELQAACRRGDREAMREAVHRLKGAAEYCGVPRLQRDIKALESKLGESMHAAGEPASEPDGTLDRPGQGAAAVHEPGPDACGPDKPASHEFEPDGSCPNDHEPELEALDATMEALLETDGRLPGETQPD